MCLSQVYYNKMAGTKKITTETGAGQWGSSLAFAGASFGCQPPPPSPALLAPSAHWLTIVRFRAAHTRAHARGHTQAHTTGLFPSSLSADDPAAQPRGQSTMAAV